MFFFKAMRPKVKQENTDASFGESMSLDWNWADHVSWKEDWSRMESVDRWGQRGMSILLWGVQRADCLVNSPMRRWPKRTNYDIRTKSISTFPFNFPPFHRYNEVRGDEFLQSELLEGTNPALFNDNIINTMNETLSVNTNKMQTTTNAPVSNTNAIESMSSGAGTNVNSSPEGVLSSVSNTMNSIDTTISNSNNNNVMSMSNALYTQ